MGVLDGLVITPLQAYEAYWHRVAKEGFIFIQNRDDMQIHRNELDQLCGESHIWPQVPVKIGEDEEVMYISSYPGGYCRFGNDFWCVVGALDCWQLPVYAHRYKIHTEGEWLSDFDSQNRPTIPVTMQCSTVWIDGECQKINAKIYLDSVRISSDTTFLDKSWSGADVILNAHNLSLERSFDDMQLFNSNFRPDTYSVYVISVTSPKLILDLNALSLGMAKAYEFEEHIKSKWKMQKMDVYCFQWSIPDPCFEDYAKPGILKQCRFFIWRDFYGDFHFQKGLGE